MVYHMIGTVVHNMQIQYMYTYSIYICMYTYNVFSFVCVCVCVFACVRMSEHVCVGMRVRARLKLYMMHDTVTDNKFTKLKKENNSQVMHSLYNKH